MTTNAKRASKSKNRLGVVGKKLGMTQVFDEQGLAIPVTVIKVDPLTVTQVKTVDSDGYNAIQVGFEPAKEKHLTKAQIGHFAKNGLDNFRNLQEFRVENSSEYKVGQQIDLSVLDNVEKVDVTGKSVGKGFQGTVKRWNFSRGPMGHGSKNHRETITKLKVVQIDKESNLLLVKGSVPGPEGKMVTVIPSRVKWN